jgi:hypothetical protein
VTVTINADDPRTIRALELTAEANHWLKGRNAEGHEVYGVPSQTEHGRYYIVTDASCDCEDFRRRDGQPCKHVLAVRLYNELVRAQRRNHLTVVH